MSTQMFVYKKLIEKILLKILTHRIKKIYLKNIYV